MLLLYVRKNEHSLQQKRVLQVVRPMMTGAKPAALTRMSGMNYRIRRWSILSFILVAIVRTGAAHAEEPQQEIGRPSVLWEVDVPGVGAYDCALHEDRLFVHVWAKDGSSRIEARRAKDGSEVWTKALGGEVGPRVGDKILVVSSDALVALSLQTGEEIWRFRVPEGGRFAANAATDGERVYIGEYRPSPDHIDAVGPSAVFCLGALRGEQIWKTVLPTGSIGAGFTTDDHHVYVIREGGMSCLSKRDGAERWHSAVFTMRELPAVLGDSVLIPSHSLSCLSAKDGNEIWTLRGGPMDSKPVIRDGIVYTPYPQHQPDDPRSMTYVPTFVAADVKTGRILWQRMFPKEVRSDPLVTSQSVYVTCWDEHLYRLDRSNGQVVWKLHFDLKQWAPSPIEWRGRLFLIFRDKIICVGESA